MFNSKKKKKKEEVEEISTAEGLAVEASIEDKELPVMDVKNLPSKFLPYPAGAKIRYRTYGWGEIQLISDSKRDIKGNAKLILEGIETSFDKESLTLGDFMWLSLLRLLSSFNTSKFKATVKCKACGNMVTHISECKDLEFEDITAKKLPVSIDINSRTLDDGAVIDKLVFKPLTIGGFFDLIDDTSDTKYNIKLMALQCINLSYENAKKVLLNLSFDDVKYINKIDKLLNHNVKSINIQCGSVISGEGDDEIKCNNKVTIQPDGGQALIIPFREREEHDENRIQFG